MPLPQIRTDIPSLINDTIRDRFYKNQFDMFMQNEYAEYQAELNNLSTALADPSDPDMASKILKSYSAATTKMITNSTRYKSNPYITQIAQSHFQHDMKQFDNITELASASMEAHAGSGDADTKLAEARTQKELALASKARAETEQITNKPQIANNFFANWDTSGSTVALGALNRGDSPALAERRQREMTEVQKSLADQIIRERARTKQINPATSMPWGTGGEAELKQVIASGEVPPERISEVWQMRTLKTDLPSQTGMTEEQIEMSFPQFNWPKKVDPNVLSRANLTPEQTGRLILGDGFENIMGGQVVVRNVQEIADKLPKDINALGPNIVTGTFNALYQENGGNPHTHEPFQNYNEYKSWLTKSLRGWANERIGGVGVSDAELDPETRGSRQRARAFMDAVIEKYGAHVARELRIPKTPEEPPGFFMRLIPEEIKSGISKAVEGIFGEEVVGPPSVTETRPGIRGPQVKPPVKKPAAPATSILNTGKVMVQALDNIKQNKYFRVQQAFMGATGFDDWEPVGPNSEGDLIIKNTKTGKTSLATWDGSIQPVTGLKPKKKK